MKQAVLQVPPGDLKAQPELSVIYTCLVGTLDFSLNAESLKIVRDPTLNLRNLPAPGRAGGY